MSRYARILLCIVLSLALVVAVGITAISIFNWNWAKPWVEGQLGTLLHREVQIEGRLEVDWKRPPKGAGWRSRIPWPEITANNVRVAQPDWTQSDVDMGRAQQLRLLVDPGALFANTVRVARLELKNADLDLQRTRTGSRNWTLRETSETSDEPAKWQFALQDLAMENVKIRIRDPSLELDIKARIDSLADKQSSGYAVGWQAEGQYKEGEISGQGKAGGLLALQESSPAINAPFPLEAQLKFGSTSTQFEGTITRPAQLAAVDLQFRLGGATMADLNPLFGTALPNTPPYETEGRLVGELASEEDVWRYEDFTGKVGSSDIRGTVQYHIREPRPLLTGTLESELLRFKDLGPLVGVDERQEKKNTTKRQPADKAVPVDTIDTDTWDMMDADVHFKGKQIVRNENLPLDNLEAKIKLQNRNLSLVPLNFGMAGGSLRTEVELDGRNKQIKARLKATARGLQLRKLLRGAESMRASLGTVNADASLSSLGNSFAELLGKSNGEFKAVVTKGTVSHFLLEAAGLNIADMVIVKLFGDEQIMLNCLAADFDVKNGLMQTKAFKLDTDDAAIDITGTINLASEKLDLDIDPENKSLRIFTLRTPLYVRGTFKNPDVGVHEGPIAARAGAAVALGVIATPLAALIPLLNLGTNDTNECAPLMKTAKEKPKAPRPGKQK